jgi:hypothetical protein
MCTDIRPRYLDSKLKYLGFVLFDLYLAACYGFDFHFVQPSLESESIAVVVMPQVCYQVCECTKMSAG